jgi:hypothetical protein
MHACLEALACVLQGGLGAREVDDHVRVTEHVLQVSVEQRVRAADERHVLGVLNRVAHGLTHPSGRAGHGHVDRHKRIMRRRATG